MWLSFLEPSRYSDPSSSQAEVKSVEEDRIFSLLEVSVTGHPTTSSSTLTWENGNSQLAAGFGVQPAKAACPTCFLAVTWGLLPSCPSSVNISISQFHGNVVLGCYMLLQLRSVQLLTLQPQWITINFLFYSFILLQIGRL